MANDIREEGGVAPAPETRGQGPSALAGVAVETLSAEDARRLHLTGGVVVIEVLPDTPANRAGLTPDDVIREINRKPARSLSDFEGHVDALSPQSPVLLLVTRGRGTIFLSLQPE